MENPPTELIDRCRQRRSDLAKRLGGGLVVVPTAIETFRNGNTAFPFRPDSDFYYLTGFPESEAVAVLSIEEGSIARSILFCRPKNADREIWDGPRFGLGGAQSGFAFDSAYPIDEFDIQLAELLTDHDALHYPFGASGGWDDRLMAALNQARTLRKPGQRLPHTLCDLRKPLSAMREIKDAFEIEQMKRAARISATAQRLAMAQTRPDRYEYEIEAVLIGAFRQAGAIGPAYPSIVASGPTACILHSVANDRKMSDGEVVLVDAACEWQYYASDITRTWPVGGRFGAAQRDLYGLVLRAQQAAIEACCPDEPADAPHRVAVDILTDGLIELGLLKSSRDEAIENQHYRRFYMHRTSHWIGLDVHDVGSPLSGDNPPRLQPGHVLTIEPGLYCPDELDIPKAFRGLGVRIEDEILITPTGPENLTREVPKATDEVEAIVGQG